MIYFPSLSREKSIKIRHIVRLLKMLRRWRAAAPCQTAADTAVVPGRRAPADVPSGHLAVCVGASSRRFVVRATYLNHPAFEKLLDRAEEEYGYANSGPLAIPCDEVLFEQLLGYLGRTESGKSARFTNQEDFQKIHIGVGSPLDFQPADSRPLLNGPLR